MRVQAAGFLPSVLMGMWWLFLGVKCAVWELVVLLWMRA